MSRLCRAVHSVRACLGKFLARRRKDVRSPSPHTLQTSTPLRSIRRRQSPSMKVELKTSDGSNVMVLVDPEASPIEIADSLEATANAPAQTQGAAKPVR